MAKVGHPRINHEIASFVITQMVDDSRIAQEIAQGSDWQEFAACNRADPELFFAEGTGAAVAERKREAVKICGECAVRLICLDYAISTNEKHGIWGGLTVDQRAKLKRKSQPRP